MSHWRNPLAFDVQEGNNMIEQSQVEQFHQNGFLVVEDVLSADEVAALQHDFDQWVEQSRGHGQGWGETVDGRARFDLESDHRPDHPSLRRVSSPTERSEEHTSELQS